MEMIYNSDANICYFHKSGIYTFLVESTDSCNKTRMVKINIPVNVREV